uniref:hypothetical protein n=1 Tax=Paractinoplanes polyasparticus TaxID=2856853 RepID=UPI001C84D586|nr:hypothetical protein [Actinoplanes polyasparticus]
MRIYSDGWAAGADEDVDGSVGGAGQLLTSVGVGTGGWSSGGSGITTLSDGPGDGLAGGGTTVAAGDRDGADGTATDVAEAVGVTVGTGR